MDSIIVQVVILSLISILCIGIYVKTKNTVALIALAIIAVLATVYYLLKLRIKHSERQTLA